VTVEVVIGALASNCTVALAEIVAPVVADADGCAQDHPTRATPAPLRR